jgi:glycosyltransferase involved in cell wall biosynthesis
MTDMARVPPRPTVSVVIPCFNQARYLPAAVASVAAQAYPSVDCLIVDDGSTDDTAAVASRLAARLLRQPNAGVSAARNAGLAATRSDLIVFLDADDELLPSAIAAEVEAFQDQPEAVAAVGRCQPIDAAGRDVPCHYDEIDASDLYREWLSRNFVWTPGAAMFARAALEAIGGFPRDLGPAADYAVYLRLARTRRIVWLPRPLVRYRQHGASMSRDPALMLRATLGVLQREQRDAPASAQAAIRSGRDSWRRWYGEQIIEGLRSDWRAGRVGARQARAALTLLHRCPEMLLRRTAGRSRRAFSWRGGH